MREGHGAEGRRRLPGPAASVGKEEIHLLVTEPRGPAGGCWVARAGSRCCGPWRARGRAGPGRVGSGRRLGRGGGAPCPPRRRRHLILLILLFFLLLLQPRSVVARSPGAGRTPGCVASAPRRDRARRLGEKKWSGRVCGCERGGRRQGELSAGPGGGRPSPRPRAGPGQVGRVGRGRGQRGAEGRPEPGDSGCTAAVRVVIPSDRTCWSCVRAHPHVQASVHPWCWGGPPAPTGSFLRGVSGGIC